MSAIAKAAGTGMGTIYNYFPNKDILINELFVSIKKREKQVYSTFHPDQPVKTQFEDHFTSIIDFFLANRAYFEFMEQLQASPIITEESRNIGAEAIGSVYQLLDKGKRDRIIKNIDTDELLLFIGGTVLSYLRWYFNQSSTKKSSRENQLRLVWDAIRE